MMEGRFLVGDGDHSMWAVVTVGNDDYDQLLYCEVPKPKPEPGEVLLQVLAAGINNTEINTRVVELGAGVDSALMSKRVLVRSCMRTNGFDSLENRWMASDFDGAFAQFVKVPADGFGPLLDVLRRGGQYVSSGAIMSGGYTQVLWERGIWFNENDVLHVLVMLWVLYMGLVVAPKVRDYSQ